MFASLYAKGGYSFIRLSCSILSISVSLFLSKLVNFVDLNCSAITIDRKNTNNNRTPIFFDNKYPKNNTVVIRIEKLTIIKIIVYKPHYSSYDPV